MTTANPKRRFSTVADAMSQNAAYWGDHREWLILNSQHRDSDSVSRSNFQVLTSRLQGTTATIERMTHWAVGWVEYLICDPSDRKALRIGIAAAKAIKDYPILDETHFSELEDSEFWQYAESELKQFDNWESAVSDALQEHNSGPGDPTAENEIIKTAREALEHYESLCESHASCPIDPAQMKLFDDSPRL